MTSTVYFVRGGMEDWAYGGSWEGYPIINHCTPETYPDSPYPKSKTDYTDKKDAIKSIMFLLEASDMKTPEMKLLGRNSLDCLINMKPNPFFNQVITENAICKDKLVDGYIPRILRISLALIDLLEPYISLKNTVVEAKNTLNVQWIVGGSVSVDESFVLYDYVSRQEAENIYKKINETKNNEDVFKIFKRQSQAFKGKGIWANNFTTAIPNSDIFQMDLKFPENSTSVLVYIVIAKVDSNWAGHIESEPLLNPQTHIVNLRTDSNFVAKNGAYALRGQKYFISDFVSLELMPDKTANSKQLKINKVN